MNALQPEGIAVGFALLYVVLAIREHRACWLAGMGSSLLFLGVFWRAALYMESALQLYYMAMAGYGWWAWRPNADSTADGSPATLTIHRWPLRRHLVACAGIAVLSVLNGWLLERYTGAALPYLDSAVSWGAVLSTWMLARKLLENWAYWFVIDSISLSIALGRGLTLTAGLFAVYLVLSIVGWRTWHATWLKSRPP